MTVSVYQISKTKAENGENEIIETFSTRVFSGNLKRQAARSHVTKPCGHVRSCQRGFSTPRGRFSRSDLLERFYPEFLFMPRTNKKFM